MPVLNESFVIKFTWRLRNLSLAISPKTKGCIAVKNKNRYRRASLTAEAALVFPVFFFGIYMLWQLFLLLMFQMSVCQTVTGTAIKYAHLGYPERRAEEQVINLSWLYQPLFWNSLPETDRIKGMWVLCIPEEDGSVLVQIGYQFICEALLFPEYFFPVQQNFRFTPYVGKTDPDLCAVEEKEEDMVYVTEYGTVYHESKACSFLNVVVRAVDADTISEIRNSFGRRYTPCERCDNQEVGEMVYYSDGGTKYHLIAGCPTLKRTVTERCRDEVELPPCHKCGSKKETREN